MNLKNTDPKVYEVIQSEFRRQNEKIELIASENFTSDAVLEVQGSVMTNKYAEGYPHARWYGGCEFVDIVEDLAIERAKKLFGAEHVNVQPHCGTQANMAVYFSMLEVGDTVLAMDLACGGHLSHGHKHNFSGKYFNVVSYGVNRDTEMLDYNEILDLAKKHKPKMILAGACAYSRTVDFKKFHEICDKAGAFLLSDIAHIAGLIAAGLHPSPIKYSEFVTTTTHKTLRGPRAGMIMTKKKFAKKIDAEVFPGIQGGPLMHVIAAKAVAFKEALEPQFKKYQAQIIANAKTLSDALSKKGYRIVSGGTDNHLMLVDLTSKSVSGKDAALALDSAGITVNKNLIPFDKESPSITSGIRLGTPAATTRGMKEKEMGIIADFIDEVITNHKNEKEIEKIRQKVKALTQKFPLYNEQ